MRKEAAAPAGSVLGHSDRSVRSPEIEARLAARHTKTRPSWDSSQRVWRGMTFDGADLGLPGWSITADVAKGGALVGLSISRSDVAGVITKRLLRSLPLEDLARAAVAEARQRWEYWDADDVPFREEAAALAGEFRGPRRPGPPSLSDGLVAYVAATYVTQLQHSRPIVSTSELLNNAVAAGEPALAGERFTPGRVSNIVRDARKPRRALLTATVRGRAEGDVTMRTIEILKAQRGRLAAELVRRVEPRMTGGSNGTR